jgi:hypothetical protein
MRVQGLGSNEIEQILVAESHKLDPRPLDEYPRPTSGQIKAKLTWHHFEGKINWFGPPKKKAQRRARGLENQDAR